MITLIVSVLLSPSAHARDDAKTVDDAMLSLVIAESRLMRDSWPRREFYPGTYRVPGAFAGRNLRGLKAERLNLRGFDFGGADLRSANFYKADLRGANLRGADLREATLISTRLEGARIDDKTQLPIDVAEALKLGMTK